MNSKGILNELRKGMDEIKQKKVIEILKDNVYFEFDDRFNAVMFKRDEYDECDYTIIYLDDKEQYDLLKEYL